MDHFQEIREKLAERELDAMMLTNEANRLYATGFHSTDTDGLALVTRKNTYYFTDSRYTEAAQRVIKNAVMREVGAGRGYGALVEEVIREEGLQKIGFEDAYMTVQDYERYRKAISCELVPATDLMLQLRMVKSEEELEAINIMRKALNGLKADEATDRILDMFARTRTNAEFVSMVKKNRFI